MNAAAQGKQWFSDWKFWAVLLWMVLIFFLSHQDGNRSSETSEWVLHLFMALGLTESRIESWNLGFWVRKTAHFTEYLILTLILFKWLSGKMKGKSALFISWITAVLYACTDELHQSFIPFRTATPFDVGVDALGGMLAVAIIFFFRNKSLRQASA